MNMTAAIGYACMNEDIPQSTYRTCRKHNISDQLLRELINHNLMVLKDTILYNIKNNNHLFRVSSSLIPFGSSDLNTLNWAYEFKDKFAEIKKLIDEHDIRISVHPGQYTVLNSPRQAVVEAALNDLEYHARILKLLSDREDSLMVLHVGGVYSHKGEAMERFIEVYKNRVSSLVKCFLVIENDDKMYTVEDVLEISKQTQLPVIFDNLHHRLNPSFKGKSEYEILDQVMKTWDFRDVKAKMHYSQQDYGKQAGAHSKTINLELFKVCYESTYRKFDMDIMLEVKDKNRSFIKVNQILHPSMKVLERQWANYKYWVMARSQRAYEDIRELFKDNREVDPIVFYGFIDNLSEKPLNLKSQRNAVQHVWGYFKKISTENEKLKYMDLLEHMKDEKSLILMYRFLRRLSVKYENTYLLDGYFFSHE